MINKRHTKDTTGLFLDNIINDQSTLGARIMDKARAANFISPDLSKMHRHQIGKTTYFFKTKKQLDNFLKQKP